MKIAKYWNIDDPANKNKIQNRQTKKEKMYIEGKINDKIK